MTLDTSFDCFNFLLNFALQKSLLSFFKVSVHFFFLCGWGVGGGGECDVLCHRTKSVN